MTWQARVYGGVKSDGDIPKPSNMPHKPPGTAQEQSNGENGAILSVLAIDAATVEIARNRLRTMHELGQSWYALGRLYDRPASTVQHWANGRGRMDNETVETILKTRLHYVTIDPGSVVVLAPGETVRKPGQRKRPAVRRPWMGRELSVEMDKAGVTDATVRWLVTRHIYERELLVGPVPGLEGNMEVFDVMGYIRS